MAKYILAHDLGTGGNKASIFSEDGECVASCFVAYSTFYPQAGWHEQRPMDWWKAVVESTQRAMAQARIENSEVVCCGVSGHSLGVVPLDREGNLLQELTPIWSDARALDQARHFFDSVDGAQWYRRTGNGFPAPLYTLFKIMWLRENATEIYRRAHKIIGTKDFINYRMTGRIVTDYSYASGSGAYDLLKWDYADDLLQAAAVPREMLPECVASSQVIGELQPQAARELGLSPGVLMAAGGVDNSCMALGARNLSEGSVYNSLGSSSWTAISSAKPLLDLTARPFVFTHVIPGMFNSAVSIFSAGSSLRWVRDVICNDLVEQAARENADVYDLMGSLAATSPVGANRLLFNPSLAGGTCLDGTPNIRGAFLGLDLGHSRADVIRAAMEGAALGLRVALDALRPLVQLRDEMILVGGGSRSTLWRQILADVFHLRIVKTNIDQQAAALGAAALAAVGAGLWDGFDRISELHRVESIAEPIAANGMIYDQRLPAYCQATRDLAKLGDMMANLD